MANRFRKASFIELPTSSNATALRWLGQTHDPEYNLGLPPRAQATARSVCWPPNIARQPPARPTKGTGRAPRSEAAASATRSVREHGSGGSPTHIPIPWTPRSTRRSDGRTPASIAEGSLAPNPAAKLPEIARRSDSSIGSDARTCRIAKSPKLSPSIRPLRVLQCPACDEAGAPGRCGSGSFPASAAPARSLAHAPRIQAPAELVGLERMPFYRGGRLHSVTG